MMASRLLSILLILQTRGHVSAVELARHFEVSVRTIYRDVDQLSAAGIPVVSDRGRAGGFELKGGFRTTLTGLTQSEAEALFLAGMPGPVAELGLADPLAQAQLKLLASLPAGMQAERIAARVHLDTAAWFQATEKAPHISTIARAVWDERVLRMRYWRGGKASLREVRPLGLVLKSGAWYLVAQKDKAILTYRAANVVEAEILDQSFQRPLDFDLSQFWTRAAHDYEAGLYRITATVRLSRHGWSLLHLLGPRVVDAASQSVGQPDDAGWSTCDLLLETVDSGVRDLLRLGADVEVLSPMALREAMAKVADDIRNLYSRKDFRQRPKAKSRGAQPGTAKRKLAR
jgi:predicted DNA-binding transcriptional regulator YafY